MALWDRSRGDFLIWDPPYFSQSKSENLIKVYRAYELPHHEIRTIGTSSQDLIGNSSHDVMTGSITGSVDRKSHSLVGSKSGSRKVKSDVNQSPVSSRVSSISKSFSLRKSNSIMTRPAGLPMGLPRRCTRNGVQRTVSVQLFEEWIVLGTMIKFKRISKNYSFEYARLFHGQKS